MKYLCLLVVSLVSHSAFAVCEKELENWKNARAFYELNPLPHNNEVADQYKKDYDDCLKRAQEDEAWRIKQQLVVEVDRARLIVSSGEYLQECSRREKVKNDALIEFKKEWKKSGFPIENNPAFDEEYSSFENSLMSKLDLWECSFRYNYGENLTYPGPKRHNKQFGCHNGWCWVYKHWNSPPGARWCYTAKYGSPAGSRDWASCSDDSQCSIEMRCGDDTVHTGVHGGIEYPNGREQAEKEEMEQRCVLQ